MSARLLAVCAAMIGIGLSPALAAEHQHHMGAAAPGPDCPDAALACASVATPAFAPDGTLWLVWTGGGRVMVAHSPDLGRSFGPAAAVTPAATSLDTGPDSRPKIVVDGAGRVVVAYAIFKDKAFNGQVLVSRSIDGGHSFAAPRPLTRDPTSQRFEALALDPGGRLFAAWIDKRSAFAARAVGGKYAGAALAFAWSDDGGDSFAAARIAQENSCECCRLGVGFAGPGRPVVLFRNVFGGTVRDHAVMTFADPATPGPVYRVSVDDWETDVCPHHGPSLAVAADGSYHAAWFADGRARQGLFYARSTDGGRTFSAPMPLGAPDRQTSRPQVLAVPDGLWLAWKEFDGERTTVMAENSRDAGRTWTAPRPVAQTGDASDHPLLVSDGRHAFLSWQTQNEGYRLLPLEDGQ